MVMPNLINTVFGFTEKVIGKVSLNLTISSFLLPNIPQLPFLTPNINLCLC